LTVHNPAMQGRTHTEPNINDESLLTYGSNTKGSGRDLTNMQQVFVQL